MKRRSTRRDVILNVLKETTCHPTANWIYERARMQIPNISLGTVYRNISQLIENGDIIPIDAGDGTIHYDARVKDHAHFYCTDCKNVSDVFFENKLLINQFAENQLGCKVNRECILFYGYCKNCLKNKL